MSYALQNGHQLRRRAYVHDRGKQHVQRLESRQCRGARRGRRRWRRQGGNPIRTGDGGGGGGAGGYVYSNSVASWPAAITRCQWASAEAVRLIRPTLRQREQQRFRRDYCLWWRRRRVRRAERCRRSSGGGAGSQHNVSYNGGSGTNGPRQCRRQYVVDECQNWGATGGAGGGGASAAGASETPRR